MSLHTEYRDAAEKRIAEIEEQLETAEQNYARLVDSLAPDLLQNRIARYVRDLEPVATCRGLACHLSAELLSWVPTRAPLPGEYADPQPVAVDTGASSPATTRITVGPDPFSGEPGTSTSAGGSWGNSNQDTRGDE